jgi:hypothetical protein
MHVYIVREPFAGFAKGDVLSQAQIDAYDAKGGHVDHHAVRVSRLEPSAAPAHAAAPAAAERA